MAENSPNSSKLNFTISVVSYSENISILETAICTAIDAVDVLKKSIQQLSTEILIIDNDGGNKLCKRVLGRLDERARESSIEVSIIAGHGNIGYGRAHNKSIKPISSGYHLFMNPDVEVDVNALLAGITYLEANTKIGMVSPNAIDALGNKQHLCKRYPTLLDLAIRGFLPNHLKELFSARLSYYAMHDLCELEPTVGIPIISGCFMLCRNRDIIRVGGFDPKFFLYFEDFDLSIRVGEKSEIAYLPSMKIKHFGGGSSSKGLRHILYFIRSAIRFFAIHGWRVY